MLENTIQIKIGKMINIDVVAKIRDSIIYVEKITFEILVLVLVKIVLIFRKYYW